MTLVILHLSDIHFRENRNVIVSRRPKIFDIIKNKIRGCSNFLIVTSGDIAFSGKNEEYAIAREFFKALFKELKEYTKVDGSILFVPGNHDCKFDTKNEEVRGLILDGIKNKGLSELSEALLSICCSPLDNYFSFINSVRKHMSITGDTVFDHPLLSVIKFNFEGLLLKINLFNSA
ncbi:metallophosphoesterase, partial [Flavihumibacter sp. CACIAM 22H1]|uniref:metallophosphoesterase family protein n=1 Tax=Flavihumibacter sp. CACIAM 22H1 TaxID=1812911 RepID=UPI0007A89945